MYIFSFIRTRYIKTITINTHIDCLNNSKCSVGDILLATKQGAFESVFGSFSVRIQHACFDRAISELRGHIYDLVGIQSADLLTTTIQAITTYMGHELCGDICRSIETFMLVMVVKI